MTGSGGSIFSPTTRWFLRSWFTKCVLTRRAPCTECSVLSSLDCVSRRTSLAHCSKVNLRRFLRPDYPQDCVRGASLFGRGEDSVASGLPVAVFNLNPDPRY